MSARCFPVVALALSLAIPATAEVGVPDKQYLRLLRYTNTVTPELPAPRAPAMPSDSLAHPFRRFAFLYEDDAGNRIDTIAGTVTKDMGTLPDRTITLRLHEDELKYAYARLLQMGFFELPEHPQYVDTSRVKTTLYYSVGFDRPSPWIRLAARTDSTVHAISWNEHIPYPLESMSDEMLRLHAWINWIWNRIVEKDAYRGLPARVRAQM